MNPHHLANVIIIGQYYRVTRKLAKGQGVMHTFLPVSMLEMPVEAGDVITKYNAPRGLDAALCIADFSALVGPAFPEVTRVVVFDGILLNQQDGNWEGFDNFRPVRTMKHARRLQERYMAYRAHSLARRAAYNAERAEDIHIGKSYRDDAVTMAEALQRGFGEGWYVRTSGNTVWSLVRSASEGLIFGYRASRYRGPNGDTYKLVTETFHPSLNGLIIRKSRPTFGEVADDEGYQPMGWPTKIAYING